MWVISLVGGVDPLDFMFFQTLRTPDSSPQRFVHNVFGDPVECPLVRVRIRFQDENLFVENVGKNLAPDPMLLK